jgi:hypothetical protein
MIQAIPKLSAKAGYRPQAEDTSIETDLLTFHRKAPAIAPRPIEDGSTSSLKAMGCVGVSEENL